MFKLRPARRALATALAIGLSTTGCYGGPCADPTAMVIVNFVIPALLIGAIIYYQVNRD